MRLQQVERALFLGRLEMTRKSERNNRLGGRSLRKTKGSENLSRRKRTMKQKSGRIWKYGKGKRSCERKRS